MDKDFSVQSYIKRVIFHVYSAILLIRMKISGIRLRHLSSFIIGYMTLAFGWWAIQLWRVNDDLFAAEYRQLELTQNVDRRGVNQTRLEAGAEYKAIVARRDKHRRMVLAEGVFFTFCLAVGLWLINRSAQKEVQLARQRRNFLLSITHELKSPIASLRLILDTFYKRALERAQQQKLAHNALRDAARLQALVEDLLLAARLDSEWTPHREPIDLDQLTCNLVESLRVRFPDAQFVIEADPNLTPLSADKNGVTSVIHNLLENAVKYSPNGSPVCISLKRNGSKRIIEVRDQGKGIPPEEREKIFEKFYRMGNEETRESTGTGLGLYIVRQIVQGHGGRVVISDNQPRGAVFTIEI
ncbi:MAG: sensor histidine kinase [Saprospiraceae bacterium]